MKTISLLLTVLLSCALIGCKPSSNEKTPAPLATANEKPTVTNNANQECEFVLGFDAWEPYQYTDVGGLVTGLDIELVAAVADSMGCKITHKQGTWVDLLMELKAGEVDILLGASKTEVRKKFAHFSDPYRMEEFSLYIRKDDDVRGDYKTIDDFIRNGSKLGLVEDYVYGSQISMLLDDPASSKFFVNAIMGELNVARLLDNDIDVFIEDSFVGASLLRRKALSKYIVAHGITIQTGNAYVMFSKKNVTGQQLTDFNLHLAKIKSSPEYQTILTKYSF